MEVEDACAEFEEQSTVDRIAKALRAGGHRVVKIPYRPGLLSRLQRLNVDIVFNIAEGWKADAVKQLCLLSLNPSGFHIQAQILLHLQSVLIKL